MAWLAQSTDFASCQLGFTLLQTAYPQNIEEEKIIAASLLHMIKQSSNHLTTSNEKTFITLMAETYIQHQQIRFSKSEDKENLHANILQLLPQLLETCPKSLPEISCFTRLHQKLALDVPRNLKLSKHNLEAKQYSANENYAKRLLSTKVDNIHSFKVLLEAIQEMFGHLAKTKEQNAATTLLWLKKFIYSDFFSHMKANQSLHEWEKCFFTTASHLVKKAEEERLFQKIDSRKDADLNCFEMECRMILDMEGPERKWGKNEVSTVIKQIGDNYLYNDSTPWKREKFLEILWNNEEFLSLPLISKYTELLYAQIPNSKTVRKSKVELLETISELLQNVTVKTSNNRFSSSWLDSLPQTANYFLKALHHVQLDCMIEKTDTNNICQIALDCLKFLKKSLYSDNNYFVIFQILLNERLSISRKQFENLDPALKQTVENIVGLKASQDILQYLVKNIHEKNVSHLRVFMNCIVNMLNCHYEGQTHKPEDFVFQSTIQSLKDAIHDPNCDDADIENVKLFYLTYKHNSP
jgi:hypothetical protein